MIRVALRSFLKKLCLLFAAALSTYLVAGFVFPIDGHLVDASLGRLTSIALKPGIAVIRGAEIQHWSKVVFQDAALSVSGRLWTVRGPGYVWFERRSLFPKALWLDFANVEARADAFPFPFPFVDSAQASPLRLQRMRLRLSFSRNRVAVRAIRVRSKYFVLYGGITWTQGEISKAHIVFELNDFGLRKIPFGLSPALLKRHGTRAFRLVFAQKRLLLKGARGPFFEATLSRS